jgi:hypothetical protein
LRHLDVTRWFSVYTDASGYALGAILAQHDDNTQEYVCHYASRLLKNAEIHYGISEIECLAIVYAIRQFRIYLHGVHFTVLTEHNALVWLMSVRDRTGKLARGPFINNSTTILLFTVKIENILMFILLVDPFYLFRFILLILLNLLLCHLFFLMLIHMKMKLCLITFNLVVI